MLFIEFAHPSIQRGPHARVGIEGDYMDMADNRIDAIIAVLQSLEQIVGRRPQVRISRLDIFADIRTKSAVPSLRRFSCRADDTLKGVDSITYPANGREHCKNNVLTGITFGKKNLLARVYDKTKQVQQDPKPTAAARRRYETGAKSWRVIRVEFQLGAEALAKMRVAHDPTADLRKLGKFAAHTSSVWQ